MDGKVFTKETKKALVKMLDDLIDLPWYLEPLDAPGFNMLIGFIDKYGDKYIPDEIDPLINESIMAAMAGNYDLAAEKASTALNAVIDVPLIEEDQEQAVFLSGITFLINLIKSWVENKKQ